MATSLRNLKVPLSNVFGTLKYGSFRTHAAGLLTPNSISPCTLYVTLSQRSAINSQSCQDRALCKFQNPPSSLQVCHASSACAQAVESQDPGIQVIGNFQDLFNVNISLEVQRPLETITRPVSLEIMETSGDVSFYTDNCLRAALESKQPVTVFSGYLDSSPYKVYCFNGDASCVTYTPLSDFERQILLFANTSKTQNASDPSAPGKPSEEQLQFVYNRLADVIPKFFVRPHDYSLYHPDVIFQNNIRGVTTQGIASYVQQLALVRTLGHLMYAHVKMEILKITLHQEDGTIRVRWRIVGIPGFRILLMFWKFKLWQWREMMSTESEWIDGFSVLHVGSDGKIYKHVCDKMMPDEEREKIKPTNVAVKLAILLGLTPQQSALECLDLNVALQSFGNSSIN